MNQAENKNSGKTAWVLGAVAACTALPASATVMRVDDLNQNIAANTSFGLDVDGNGSFDIRLSNSMAYAGSNYWGTPYYNRSVSIGGAGYGDQVSGVQAAPGSLIGPAMPMTGSAVLDSTSASFYSGVVGYGSYSYSCGWKSTCHGSYPYYGTLGSYAAHNPNLGNNLLFGFQFLDDGGQTDFGWLDLSISNPSTQMAYGFTLNGFGWDDSGAAVAAGAAASVAEAIVPDVSAVPEPGTLMLLAVGALGMARYRRRVQ